LGRPLHRRADVRRGAGDGRGQAVPSSARPRSLDGSAPRPGRRWPDEALRGAAESPRRRQALTDAAVPIRLVIATRSAAKARELRDLLDVPGLDLVSLDALGLRGEIPGDGATFDENPV